MNLRNLGFSTGVFYPLDIPLSTILKRLLDTHTNNVEINLATPKELANVSEQDIELANQFELKTIHAPFKNVHYNADSVKILQKLKALSNSINAHYVLFHPDTVDDFSLIHDVLGQLAAFENMDVRKSFGNSVSDLDEVFKHCPQSGWVCDLNHVYTIDKTMQLSRNLHKSFDNRLVGYHISGYGDETVLHTCFYVTHELQILDAVENPSVPVIHEGGNVDDPDFLKKELHFLDNSYNMLTRFHQ